MVIDTIVRNKNLIEEQGLELFKYFLQNILGYDNETIIHLGYKHIFKVALKCCDDGYVSYKTDKNGDKILKGYSLSMGTMLSRRYELLIICGDSIGIVQRILKEAVEYFSRFEVFNLFYYFPVNDEIRYLFEDNNFELERIREKAYSQDFEVMEFKLKHN